MATTPKSGDKPVKPKAAATARKVASPAKSAKPAAAAAKKPAAATKKPATVVKAAKSSAAAKPAKAVTGTTKPSKAKAGGGTLAPDQRRYYIEVAAYYIAERRGFLGGNALEDWTAAEVEVDRLLREGVLNP
ncbi:MAG: DUF2934 domain-containing protein [Rhodocyclaceae bacterium]|nr:DUF2934 domain-containing protein [Rhodocyclaceae bacterium]